MNSRDTLVRAILAIAIVLGYAVPSDADPSPSPTPSPAPVTSPEPDVSPVASPSGSATAAAPDTPMPSPSASASPSATSDVPSPSSSGSYKEDLKMAALATSLLLQAQSGEIDRSMLESKMDLALSPSMVQNVSAQLAPLGKPKSITLISRSVNGNYVAYRFRIVWADVAADESFALNPDGKIVAWGFIPAS